MKNTYTYKADFCQERDFGQKISATFEFLAAHARPLGKSLLYFVLPAFILLGMAQAALQYQTFQQLDANKLGRLSALERLQEFGGTYGLVSLFLFIGHSMLPATVYGYVRARLLLPAAEVVQPAQVWAQVRPRLLALVLAYLASSLVIILGMLFFLIPGIYLTIPLSMAGVVLILEDRGIGDSISRCLSLAKGKWWSTCGLLVVMYLIVAVLTTIVSIPNTVLTVFKTLNLAKSIPAEVGAALALVSTTLSSFFYLPLLIAPMFQYFNLVERTEGHGLHALVESLGGAAPVVHNHHLRPDEEGEY